MIPKQLVETSTKKLAAENSLFHLCRSQPRSHQSLLLISTDMQQIFRGEFQELDPPLLCKTIPQTNLTSCPETYPSSASAVLISSSLRPPVRYEFVLQSTTKPSLGGRGHVVYSHNTTVTLAGRLYNFNISFPPFMSKCHCKQEPYL